MGEARRGPLRGEDRTTSNDKRPKREEACAIDEREGKRRGGKEMCREDPIRVFANARAAITALCLH